MNYLEALVSANKIEGSLVELGFGKGNSLKDFISFMNGGDAVKRNIWIYESFTGYNDPSPEDQDAFVKGGFKRPIQPAYDIKNTIKKEVQLIKGYIEDTLPSSYKSSEPIAVIHSHLVSYTSTLHGLNALKGKIVDNGIIIVTDYETFPGTKQAVDEFVSANTHQWKLSKGADDFVVIKKIKIVELDTKVTRTRTPAI